MITVREIAGPNELEICRALRRTVFIEEQNVAEAEEWDGRDGDARHILVFVGDTPVGTARLRTVGTLGKIERVCVLAEARGSGAGRALMRFALDRMQADPDLTGAKLGAQTHAIPFYESFGFEAYGPEYDDAGIPHRDMQVHF
ncbi:GNAT family N-acetyltransferase [Tropicimonas sp. S265A]|uniref:GNAT family N-acetyltransferase n=1 Tax=Tropicimonas sp. S265A TaxID=3415134 RepID=UPI003C797504